MPLIISISASAAASFSADDGWGRPPPNMNDIMRAALKRNFDMASSGLQRGGR